MDTLVATASAGPGKAGTYGYDDRDRLFLAERVAEFRDQVRRRMSGALSEDEFKPLRLMNGLYLQLHAYMLRIAVPYGVITAAQMRRLASIARRHDRGYGHITTRQNVQFNWIRLEDAPEILAELAEVDMHAIQTSGNCIRNVTADEFAGAAADEVVDPRVHAEVLRQWSTLHPEFAFLPRKFKIAIGGSARDRVAARFHDIGILARRDETGAIGFTVHAGGGLGRTPVVGVTLREFVPEAELLAYLEAILRVYNAHGRRDNIYKARIKILVQAMGRDAFLAAVEAEFARMDLARYRLAPERVAAIASRFGAPALVPDPSRAAVLAADRARDRDFDLWVRTNTYPHRVAGYICAVASLKPAGGIPGDITADAMDGIAALAERHAFGELRSTHLQNLVLAHVRQDELHALWRGLVALGLGAANVGLIGDIVCCPGLDYCALANARSIPIARRLSERYADRALQERIGEMRINISGCINACGHHHAASLGILGVDKKGREAFQITLGGSGAEDASIGEIIGPARDEDETVAAIGRILDAYLARREPQERFLDTTRRLGLAPFREAAYAGA